MRRPIYPWLQSPRPEPVEITPDMTITKYPDGKPQRHTLDGKFRDANGRTPGSGRVVPKLIRVSIECTTCGFSNPLMIGKRGLKRIRGRCQRCSKPFDVQWSGVKSS